MVNQMRKSVNHLSRKKMFKLEKTEHGLKSNPSPALLKKIEQNEHKLKRPPTMAQMLKIESVEHGSKKSSRI